MRKEIENPRFATNSDIHIEYDSVSYDNEGNEKNREVVSVEEGSEEFSSILEQFGEEKLLKNKELDLEKIGSPSGLTNQSQAAVEEQRKKDVQMEVFRLKSFFFETKLIRETENKELRRNIRKSQTSEEVMVTAVILLMEELFDLKADPKKVSELLSVEEQND